MNLRNQLSIVLAAVIGLVNCDKLLGFELRSTNMQEPVSRGDPTARDRVLLHTHLQSSPLYGNSTDLQYFYVNVYVGSQKQRQALIVDTGSGIAAFPCQNSCKTCGKHINEYFDLEKSSSEYIFNCKTDQCNCVENNLCDFSQSYGEGSSYQGYLVKDQVHFGETTHFSEDAFNYTFGCVTTETNLFFSQDADGILGLTKSNGASTHMRPIFDVMKEKGIISSQTFTLCLGKNGGYF